MQIVEQRAIELFRGELGDHSSFVESLLGLSHFGEFHRGLTAALGIAL